MGKHEELREIISDMRAHGFTQLRRTTHGWLYGFQTFRILIPHDLQDSHRASSVSMTQQEWTKLRGQVRGENPGLAAIVDTRYGDLRGPTETVSVDEIEPVVNIEDIVSATEAADTATVAVALAPDPPHELNERTTNPFDVPFNIHPQTRPRVPEPSPKEDTTMASFPCEKCDRKFTTAAAAGRHRTAMHGLEHRDKRRQYEKRPASTSTKAMGTIYNAKVTLKPAKGFVINTTDYGSILRDMVEAVKKLEDAYNALLTERNHYRQERDELASRVKKFDAMKELFK